MKWTINCVTLIEVALSHHQTIGEDPDTTHVEDVILQRFQEGCILASQAAVAFLVDIGVIMQLLVPGIMERYPVSSVIDKSIGETSTFDTWNKLETIFQLESLSQMLEAIAVREVVSNWYDVARSHAKSTTLPSAVISDSGSFVTSRLFQTQGFRIYDWPMESCHDVVNFIYDSNNDPEATGATPMDIDPVECGNTTLQLANSPGKPQPPPLVASSSKRSVALLGGFTLEFPMKNIGGPRIGTLPSSYTDLYAELGLLLPDSEHTAVCLICGEVLNAGGKGECTRHSYKCGAGTGMFFLLQDCTGLIMHNGKAAYIHSPYVDNHGETPQYRGRPLNLDLDRYDHLHEVWSGHGIRQHVSAERGTSRHIIVPDFY
jgi:hypothetical protein